uniref:Uncharacterized protein n=1 Tax=Micrurus carvalhoi TaxID=3147026 RepID=A0A2H6N8M7_9SAUR
MSTMINTRALLFITLSYLSAFCFQKVLIGGNRQFTWSSKLGEFAGTREANWLALTEDLFSRQTTWPKQHLLKDTIHKLIFSSIIMRFLYYSSGLFIYQLED